jgi:hypothetical protein
LLPGGRDIEPWTPAALKQDAYTAGIVDNYRPCRLTWLSSRCRFRFFIDRRRRSMVRVPALFSAAGYGFLRARRKSRNLIDAVFSGLFTKPFEPAGRKCSKVAQAALIRQSMDLISSLS